jgi:16S rRNA (guanine1207-N2)-methyltransferase
VSGHYFDAEPTVASAPREIRWSVGDREFSATTDTGVFSGEQLDPGTAVLLERGPAPAGGVLLDLGCGWGPIAVSLADRLAGATVWAVDINSRALQLARINADRAGVGPRVHTALPDEVPADQVFDEIWSNPPVRIGKPALHDLLLRWLPRLRPGGAAHLVVGRHLGADSLATWLTSEGYAVTRTASARGYRVLRVSSAPAGM